MSYPTHLYLLLRGNIFSGYQMLLPFRVIMQNPIKTYQYVLSNSASNLENTGVAGGGGGGTCSKHWSQSQDGFPVSDPNYPISRASKPLNNAHKTVQGVNNL